MINGERRGLTLGIVLLALGAYFLLRRSLSITGPAPILLVIGAVLFALSAARRFRGPLLPALVLLGLGAGFLLREPLSPWLTEGGSIVLGLGCGLLAVAAIDSAMGRRRGPGPLVGGLVLVAVAAGTALSRVMDLSTLRETLDHAWPWLLIGAGLVLVAASLRKRTQGSTG
jgi:hypothetical protein